MLPPVVTAAALLLLLASLPAALPTPTASGPHIGDVNVLLPPRITYPVEYRLLGSGGCFSWTWDHHDILSVQPEFNGSNRCSTSARLISIAPYTTRKETAVYATDLQSGTTIRCKVLIDSISRIQIFHHAVKIDLDELATLHVHAFDDEENEFSSLVGLQFLWQHEPKSSGTGSIHHLVHVPLKETPLSDFGGFRGDLGTQIQLEDRGVGSDLYVVKGIGIGHEVVSVQLLEPWLEHLVDKIVLTVAEAMSLYPPSPLFVTLGALMYYNLRIVRHGTPQAIDLPSPHHRWSVINSSVVKVDSMMGIAHALNLGITNVIVEDTRLSGHVQISAMHVVIPDRLCLYIIPVTNMFDRLEGTTPISSSAIWYVFPGQSYIIQMKVFSQEPSASEIYITENNDLKLGSKSPGYWNIDPVPADIVTLRGWKNSRVLKPHSTGQGTVTASLTYHYGSPEIAEVLRVEQQVTVCSKVKISILGDEENLSPAIRLPWASDAYQEVTLKATGGCGKTSVDYSWSSSDATTVFVSAYGMVKAKKPGQVTIQVASIFDPVNYDKVIIEVSIPSSMVVLPIFPVEAVIGTELQAAVALKTSNGNYYHKCDAFNTVIRWKVFSESGSFKIVNTTAKLLDFDMLENMEGSNLLSSRPCSGTYLYASRVGRAVVHATFSCEHHQSFDSTDHPIVLNAAFVIAAYLPLVVLQGENGNQFGGYWHDSERLHSGIQDLDYTGLDELYLVPGSAMNVLFSGGPERWDDRIEYIENIQIRGEEYVPVTDSVLVHPSSSNDGGLYQILCEKLGKFNLLFSRGNLVGSGHPMPVIANVELSIICSFPSSITLIANEPANTIEVIEAATRADRKPGRIRVSPIIVANGCTIRVAAVGIHATQRPFANSSSLSLRWELSGCEDLARWNDIYSSKGSAKNKWERFLYLQNASGVCTVRATVTEFSDTVANSVHGYTQLLETAGDTLTDAIRLQLVSSLRIIPDLIVLVFNPEAKANLSVSGGSCFLDVGVNDTQVGEIALPPEHVQCSHLLVSARGLGTALLTVRDVGLSPPATATALVKVANVDWIKIITEEEISLMEGSTKAFDILAGTQEGWVFDSSQYLYMDIGVHLEDNILEPVNENHSSTNGGWIVSGSSFSVKGAALGVTTLYVTIRQQFGNEISSQPVKVEVYKPLHIHPEYVYLLPGASYVLTVKGGPQLGTFVEYYSMHEDTATVHRSSGRVSAISLGNATVHVSSYGTGGNLICEAYGRVEVHIPSSVILNLQSDELCIGCEMPVSLSVPKGNLFSFYEICKNYMWSIEIEEVITFQRPRPVNSDVSALQLSCMEGKNGTPCYQTDEDIGFINVLLGRSVGRTRVHVSFSCDFVSSSTPQPVYYNASATVTVVSDPPLALGLPITWVLPPFYTTSDLLPGTVDSYGQLDSHENKRRTAYSVLRTCARGGISKQQSITVDGSKIRTREKNELSCIQAKDQTTGRTEIASCVRVAEVAQVRVATAESTLRLVYLAVHAKLELSISYCDALGYPFYEANDVVPLDVETNYPDIVSILMTRAENSTHPTTGNVLIQARGPGRALVRISISHNPVKSDFILVTVGAQLHPRNPIVHVGHRLNFSIVGDDLNRLKSGQWVGSNSTVLTVNKISGEVQARGEGVSQVIFEGSNFKLQTKVTVLKVEQISIDAPAETLTNFPFPSKGYKFPVGFSDPHDYKLEASGNYVPIPYDCRVDPPYIGYAKPWSDHATGHSYCLFFPYSPKHLANSMSKSKVMQSEEISNNEGFMYISIIVSLKEAPEVTGSAHAPFVAGFAVAESGKLKLTPNSNRSLITVMGNADVEIYWNATDLMSVSLLRRDGVGIGQCVQYEIKVLRDEGFADKIMILLPSTGQTAAIDVSYETQEKTTPQGTSGIKWSMILVCVLVLILTIVVFMRLLERPDRSMHSSQGCAPPSTVVGPATPDRTSASNIQSSPRTPQPFMEYVRRTIDETPYYRRDARRRFDPQNTY